MWCYTSLKTRQCLQKGSVTEHTAEHLKHWGSLLFYPCLNNNKITIWTVTSAPQCKYICSSLCPGSQELICLIIVHSRIELKHYCKTFSLWKFHLQIKEGITAENRILPVRLRNAAQAGLNNNTLLPEGESSWCSDTAANPTNQSALGQRSCCNTSGFRLKGATSALYTKGNYQTSDSVIALGFRMWEGCNLK